MTDWKSNKTIEGLQRALLEKPHTQLQFKLAEFPVSIKMDREDLIANTQNHKKAEELGKLCIKVRKPGKD